MKRVLLMIALLLPLQAQAANKVQELKTPGGLTVWLVEEHSLPIVTANVSFKESGFAYDPEGKEGRGNLVASLMLEGAGDLRAKEFNEQLEEYAIRLSIGGNDDMLNASLETLAVNKEKAFAMLGDALTRPRFDDDAIERARAKIQALLVEKSESPAYKLSVAWQQSIFGNHPYARLGLGSKESLGKLTKDDFNNYTKRYLTRENIVISVVGDITPAQLGPLLDTHFANLPAKYTPDSTVAEAQLPASADTKVITHDIPQSMVRFGFAGLKRNDPDYLPAYVVNYILGGDGLSSRLGSEIRVKRGLAYSVASQLEPMQHAGIWRGMFATKNTEVKKALETLKATLADYVKNGVTQSELDAAKAYLTGSFVLDLSSNQEVANFLTIMQIHSLGSDYLEKRNGLIEKVTLADVKRVSDKFIDPAHLRIVIVGKPEL